jgi:hypothetical protein
MLLVPESLLFMATTHQAPSEQHPSSTTTTTSAAALAAPPSSSSSSSISSAPAAAAPAPIGDLDSVQWLVGYRHGGMALYEWRRTAAAPTPASTLSGSSAELLWYLQLDGLPLSLSAKGWGEQASALAVGGTVYDVR